MNLAGILFIISAPSGSGKSTLVNQLRTFASGLEFSISYTTRAPRGSEKQGREYHFVTREQFERMIAADEFLEFAEVFGHYYGTVRRSFVDAEHDGKDLLLDIDVQGARLRNRSRAEGKVDEDVIERRLAEAKQEIENYCQYGYILVNDVLDRAVEELAAIVTSERILRVGGTIDSEAARMIAISEACRQRNSTERLRPVLGAFGLLEDVVPIGRN